MRFYEQQCTAMCIYDQGRNRTIAQLRNRTTAKEWDRTTDTALLSFVAVKLRNATNPRWKCGDCHKQTDGRIMITPGGPTETPVDFKTLRGDFCPFH